MCLLSRVFKWALALWVMESLVIISWSQDPGLLHEAIQELDHRHVLRHMAFYMGAGDLNSGLHGCAADTLPTKQLSSPPCGFVKIFLTLWWPGSSHSQSGQIGTTVSHLNRKQPGLNPTPGLDPYSSK